VLRPLRTACYRLRPPTALGRRTSLLAAPRDGVPTDESGSWALKGPGWRLAVEGPVVLAERSGSFDAVQLRKQIPVGDEGRGAARSYAGFNMRH
jgi:hypothetical protein